jgi:hypothetical protein
MDRPWLATPPLRATLPTSHLFKEVEQTIVSHQNDLVPNLPGYFFDYRHVSPQYWITAATGAPVNSSDIEVSSGIEDESGDYCSLLEIFETSFTAHTWYFNDITACFADNNGTISNGR